MPRPVVELTATDTHFHMAAFDTGERFALPLEVVLMELGYEEHVHLASEADVDAVAEMSILRRDRIEEARRLNGVYSPASDSVLFEADAGWMRKRSR